MQPESVQLAYQIAVQGRADLALAPDEATGFSMTLLRLLAFQPAAEGAMPTPSGRSAVRAPAPAADAAAPEPRVDRNVGAIREPARSSRPSPLPTGSVDALEPARATPGGPPAAAPRSDDKPKLVLPEAAADWPGFVSKLHLIGMAAQLAAQSELKSVRGNALSLAIPASHKHLADKTYADKLKIALEAATGRKLLLAFEIGESNDGSPAAIARREREQARAESEAAFRNEPFVRDLVARFDATVRRETIETVARDASAPQSTTQETP